MQKHTKRWFSILLALVLMAASLAMTASAEAGLVDSGTCGENLTWAYYDDGTLTISGTGEMTNYLFYGNAPWYAYREDIKTVNLPDGLTSVGDSAFLTFESLKSIKIPDSVTHIGNDAFYQCTSLEAITLPSSLMSIGSYAFAFSSALKSITIPKSVISIGESLFASCASLTNIYVDSLNERFSSLDGVLFNKDKTSLMQYPVGNSRKSYKIPEGVTSIEYNAFHECRYLQSITIPDSLTVIGDYAFTACLSLTGITIPSTVTHIGNSAFQSCLGLTSVTIPDSVISIGNYAFCNNPNLVSLIIPESVTSIGYSIVDRWAESFAIYGVIGSYAEEYALENGIPFDDINNLPTPVDNLTFWQKIVAFFQSIIDFFKNLFNIN